MMTALDNAIENLYVAFSNVPIPSQIDGCPCCLGDIDKDKLLSTPLREISADDISKYASSAFLTVGTVSDYLYFIPRIIELSIRDPLLWPCIEVTGRAVQASGLTMKDSRCGALTDLLRQYIEYLVESGDYRRIDEWMCAIGRMEFDVKPFLAIIENEPKAILRFWEDNSGKLHDGQLGNEFWDPPNSEHDEIVKWFRSDRISKVYAEAYGYKS